MKIVDLSHTIEHEMITYKGLPGPVICDFYSREESKAFYEKGTTFQIGKIEMVANTGTYIDAPFHRYEDGPDLAGLELNDISNVEGILIDARGALEIGPEFFKPHEVSGKAVIVWTSWAKHWRTKEYFHEHPFLTEDAAIYLKNQEAKLVGIDSHNIDDTRSKSRPVHTVLLGTGIPIVEHLCNLENLEGKDFKFNATPPKIRKMGSFPVRANAVIYE